MGLKDLNNIIKKLDSDLENQAKSFPLEKIDVFLERVKKILTPEGEILKKIKEIIEDRILREKLKKEKKKKSEVKKKDCVIKLSVTEQEAIEFINNL